MPKNNVQAKHRQPPMPLAARHSFSNGSKSRSQETSQLVQVMFKAKKHPQKAWSRKWTIRRWVRKLTKMNCMDGLNTHHSWYLPWHQKQALFWTWKRASDPRPPTVGHHFFETMCPTVFLAPTLLRFVSSALSHKVRFFWPNLRCKEIEPMAKSRSLVMFPAPKKEPKWFQNLVKNNSSAQLFSIHFAVHPTPMWESGLHISTVHRQKQVFRASGKLEGIELALKVSCIRLYLFGCLFFRSFFVKQCRVEETHLKINASVERVPTFAVCH